MPPRNYKDNQCNQATTYKNQQSSSSLLISQKGKTWEPKYNLLFETSNCGLNITEQVELDDRDGQLVYAKTAGSLQPHGILTVEVLSEGKILGKDYTFSPFYDPGNYYVLNVTRHQVNPKLAKLTLYNNTDLTHNWNRGAPLGILEQVTSIHVANHKCEGNRDLYGSDSAEWYKGNQADDLLNSLVSVNQQTNYYQDKLGNLVAGPAPNKSIESCRVTFHNSTQSPGDDPNIQIVVGDLTNRTLFGKSDVICQQVNASTISAHGLARELENTYPYGTIYSKKISKRNILSDNQLRSLGTCHLLGDDHPTNPYIANLVGQFFYGRAVDDKGKQEIYANKFADICTPIINKKLQEDTRGKRLIWFEAALEDLHQELIHLEENQKPLRIFFPYRIGCTSAHGIHKDYLSAIGGFAEKMKAGGMKVYLVKCPEACKGQQSEDYPTIQPANPQKFKHRAGPYKDAPSTFCKDLSCHGCQDNKLILALMGEEIGEEFPESDLPITGIEDGMSPDVDIPSAETNEDKKMKFEELLTNVNIGDKLTSTQEEEVKDLLREFTNLFITSEDDPPGLIRGLEVDIPTIGNPISCKMRRFNPKALHIMEEINKTMLRKGLTRPCDGPWSSPVVLVKKKPIPGQQKSKDNLQNYRFCVDYRAINEKSVVWRAYPVSDMKQVLHKAAGYRYNSTIDVNSAFHCVAIRSRSQPVTAFALPSGLFCFTRLPFGLSISP